MSTNNLRNVSLQASSSAGNRTEYPSPTNGEAFRAARLLLYAVIFVISIVGNSLVCIVLAKLRGMRTVTNFLILNLAIADLAVTCICIPFDIPVQENDYKWPYGGFACRLLYPLQTAALFASIFTLTVLSLNRYRAIVFPLRQQIDVHHMRWILGLIWGLSLLLTSPYIAVLQMDRTKNECGEVWPNMEARRAYTASLFVFQYILPLTVITFTYVRIGTELKKRLGAGNPACSSALFGSQYQRETRQVLRMLVVVTLLFGVSVLPNNVMWLWMDFGNGGDYPYFSELVAITNIILFANSAANPIAYAICHENFREKFKLCFTCSLHTPRQATAAQPRFGRPRSLSDSLKTRLMSMSQASKKDSSTVDITRETLV